MTDVKVRLKTSVNSKAILRLSATLGEKMASNAAEATQKRARRFAPVRTGALRESIAITRLPSRPGFTTFAIGSHLPYARYQEHGTGPIFAKPGRWLVFQVKGRTVFAKKTRGVPATHFMEKARLAIRESDFKP